MRAARLALAFLALFVLVVACASGARLGTPDHRPDVVFVIENQNYHAANFYLVCDGTRVRSVSAIEMGQTRTIAHNVAACREIGWIVRLSLTNETWEVYGLALSPGDEVHVRVSSVLYGSGFLVTGG